LDLHDPLAVVTACLRNVETCRHGKENTSTKTKGSRQRRFGRLGEPTRGVGKNEIDALLSRVASVPSNTFSSEQATPRSASSRCETAVRVGFTGWIRDSETKPDGERCARSRARASCVVPRR
jgi:hypothetical protein